MISQYAHPYPAVRDYFDGQGWKTDGPSEEGLLWVVRTQETIDRRNHEEAALLNKFRREDIPAGIQDSAEYHADEYVVADRVELRDGHLIFSLGTPQHKVAVKVYAPGYWREFHLLGEAEESAKRIATMLKEEGHE